MKVNSLPLSVATAYQNNAQKTVSKPTSIKLVGALLSIVTTAVLVTIASVVAMYVVLNIDHATYRFVALFLLLIFTVNILVKILISIIRKYG